MVFSSTAFLFAFLPVTLLVYYLISRKLKNAFLLIMSLLFYAAGEPKFVFVMAASILANYLLGIALQRAKGRALPRRLFLLAALAVNLGILFFYKYFDFAITNINGILGTELPLRHIALPIGISFFTFQGMSYVLDVYMEKAEAEKNPLNVALYIAVFPQLIAGPIVRYTDIKEEIRSRTESREDFAEGVARFAFGLAKKVVIADNVALLADHAFSLSAEGKLTAGLAWLGAIAYTMQIYFDFSGYSDMAIGLGRMFGFHFNENFNYPYVAKSMTDFWRRWHISLSRWFRDYVYIPMGGNRTGNVYVHLAVVFLLTGIWHGASWNFVVWGLWHGAFLVMERVFRKRDARIPELLSRAYTALAVILGWVLFRVESLPAALRYMSSMFGANGWGKNAFVYNLQLYAVVILISAAAMLPVFPVLKERLEKSGIGRGVSPILEPICVGLALCAGIVFTVAGSYHPFIYFNF